MTLQIGVIGAALAGNQGARIMVETVVDHFKNRDAHFWLFSHYPDLDKEINNRRDLRIVSGTPLAIFPTLTRYYL